jgi:TonB family protein
MKQLAYIFRTALAVPLAVIVVAGGFLVFSSLYLQQPTNQTSDSNFSEVLILNQNMPSKEMAQLLTEPDLPDISTDFSDTELPCTIDQCVPDLPPTTGPLPPTMGPLIYIQPTYPTECLKDGLEGRVKVAFDINNDGIVHNARIIDSSHSCFEQTSLEAVSKMRFRPSKQERINVHKTFVFRISS